MLIALFVTSPIFVFAQAAIVHDLYIGLKSDEVRVLQQTLQDLGYFSKTIQPTDYFGPVTKRSVQDFQRANGVPITGYAGPLTRRALTKTKISDGSLHSVARIELAEAKKVVPNTELFEMRAGITQEGSVVSIKYPYSYYASPGDDLKHTMVVQYLVGNSPPYKETYEAKTGYFVVKSCGGGAPPPPDMHCGEPTGETESHERHLPVRNWTIDVNTIVRAARENNVELKNGNVVVTTAGRAKNKNYLNPFADSIIKELSQLQNSQSIVILTEEGKHLSPTDQFNVSHYLVLDGETGKVLGTGEYRIGSPPA